MRVRAPGHGACEMRRVLGLHELGLAVTLLTGQLSSRPPDPCLSSDECAYAGYCTSLDGECVVASDEDCRRSERCHEKGFCTALDGRCVAGSNEDCRASQACTQGDACFLEPEEHVCDDGTKNADTPLLVGGVAAASAGGAAVIVGIVLTILQVGECSYVEEGIEEQDRCPPVLGPALIGGGALVALAAGMPMAIVGGRGVPRDELKAAPTVIVAPTGAALRWSF